MDSARIIGARSSYLAFLHDSADGGVVQAGVPSYFLLAVVELLHHLADLSIPLRFALPLIQR